MSANLLELTDQSFDGEVFRKDAPPMLVEFGAPWCVPCRQLLPILQELASEYEGRLRVAQLNCDDHSAMAARYQVRSVPVLILFAGGRPATTVTGRTKEALRRELDDQLRQAA